MLLTNRLETQRISIEASNSPLGLDDSECKENPGASRYLAVKGKRAFDAGNYCGTCPYLFDRLEGAPLYGSSPDELDRVLQTGLSRLNPDVMEIAAPLIPQGVYSVSLFAMTPTLVTPYSENDYFTHEQAELWGSCAYDYWTGLPHFTHTAYYRTSTVDLGGSRRLYEFLVPLYPTAYCDMETVSGYVEKLVAGERPTALALSVLDVKQPANWDGEPTVTEHWCMTHYLVDGHHKMKAAATAHRPVSLLSYLDLEKSAATPEEVDRVLASLTA